MKDCTEWQGAKFHNGYGSVAVKCPDGKWRPKRIHRQTWIDSFGPIAPGLDVMHLCDNRKCYNIHHLALGTHRANMRDCENKKKGYQSRGEKSGRSKLQQSDVIVIRLLIAYGQTDTAIAKQFNVSSPAIRSIRIGRTWSWLQVG